MKLKVWWSSNLGYIEKPIDTVENAKKWIIKKGMEELKNDNIIWNAGGLEVFEDNEWCEWYNEEGYDIKEIMDEEENETLFN